MGHWCTANTTDYLPNICPAGYYCPLNTESMYQLPCPEGTFNNLTQQHSNDSCISCTGGYYCQGEGLSEPTGLCDEGWYCIRGAINIRVRKHIKCDILFHKWTCVSFLAVTAGERKRSHIAYLWSLSSVGSSPGQARDRKNFIFDTYIYLYPIEKLSSL